jgi:hypothetical protein
MRPYPKNSKTERTGGITQMVELLPGKLEGQSSKPNNAQKPNK